MPVHQPLRLPPGNGRNTASDTTGTQACAEELAGAVGEEITCDHGGGGRGDDEREADFAPAGPAA
ncbi:hypothetical protein ACFWBV_10155 [Streptomyces sp. NPDC060030]|uniref:hypothetical protein n=1 Tax=Streptomyces sp. NPDC060030 TaxID=3347042 RepID=UPI00369EB9B5